MKFTPTLLWMLPQANLYVSSAACGMFFGVITWSPAHKTAKKKDFGETCHKQYNEKGKIQDPEWEAVMIWQEAASMKSSDWISKEPFLAGLNSGWTWIQKSNPNLKNLNITCTKLVTKPSNTRRRIWDWYGTSVYGKRKTSGSSSLWSRSSYHLSHHHQHHQHH